MMNGEHHEHAEDSSQTKAGIAHQQSLFPKWIEQAIAADFELETSPEYPGREKAADKNGEADEIPYW